MARTRPIKPETLFVPQRLMERLASMTAYPLTLVETPSERYLFWRESGTR